MMRNIGQISVLDDLNNETPSVFIMNDKLTGFVYGHKKFPRRESSKYSFPSYISLMIEGSRSHRLFNNR